MLKVYNCIVTAHDLRLVALAAAICALASFTAISLLRHARSAAPAMQGTWLTVASVSTGFGIWATHFIAMLAFSPGIPNAYNIALTIVSLLAAILMTRVGFGVALLPSWSGYKWLGGAVVAGGIATMHYVGMAAFEVAGIVLWDPTLVAASILLGGVIGAAALPAGLRRRGGVRWRLLGTVLLTLAICSHHFTAMGAISIIPDPTLELSRSSLPAGLMSVGVALVSFAILLLALAAVAVDLRDRMQATRENERMRGLADAAVEGLMVCDGTTVVTVNTSLATLAGMSVEAMVGTPIDRWLQDQSAIVSLMTNDSGPIETELCGAEGIVRAVELIVRPVDFAGRPHQAIAVRDLTARNAADQHIKFLAHHDSLTGIPNRSFFNEQLDQEIAVAALRQQKLAVFCLDLDRFKEVNDLYGHAAGDKMLQAVAARIKTILKGRQVVARLGGDEFAVLVPNIGGEPAAANMARNIVDLLGTKDGSLEADTICTSIGIAIYPDHADDRQTLLSHADTALYRAKSEGRNTWRFFEASMGAAVRDRRVLEHDLRHAVGRNEMRLVYQPQNDITSGRTIGFEALLRWDHPERGSVSPAAFVPIAEEAGSIIQIGEWVLRTACREAASWPQPLTIAVNVSAVQIYSENFVQVVHLALLETGLSASRLELEITETALIRDLDRALGTLRRIKALGVRVAMDDFGTGYSSLSNLRAFPFDKIKIDASFIRSVDTNMQAATIVRAVLGLGRGLGLPVLAEGVETFEELKFLEGEQCQEVQGFLTGRPGDIAQFRELTHDEDEMFDPEIFMPAKVA